MSAGRQTFSPRTAWPRASWTTTRTTQSPGVGPHWAPVHRGHWYGLWLDAPDIIVTLEDGRREYRNRCGRLLFAVDERAIPVGASVMLAAARRFLDGER